MPLDHATEFALSFTADAVHLLRRETDGAAQPWQSLGSADFASASFRADLAALRARAADPDLQGQDLPVVLLIPQDQILYTSLSVPLGPERDAAVGQALDGLTPYEIEELAFDWTDEGADVRVAAVARQTLVEARDFAERHGFASFGYSALPEAEDYPGMPVFGLPEDADDEMPDAISLDLDADQPDAFADEAGFRTRDGHDDPAPDAEAEDITDVSFTELTAGAEATVPEGSDAGEDMDIDQAQPVLSGLELPEQAAVEASEVEGEVTGAPADPEADQAELFAEMHASDPVDDAGQDDGGVTQDPPHEVIHDSAPLIAAKDEPVDPEVAGDSVRAPQFDGGGDDGADDGMQEPVLAMADLDAGAVDKGSVGEATDTAALHGETPDAITGAAEGADMNSGDAASPDAPDRDDDELTEAERAALAAAAAELAATEIAAGAARARLRAEPSQRVGASGAPTVGAPTVVRHAPPRDTGAKGRASGVKPAAATAPKAAADGTESASAATRQVAKRGGLVELIAMLGALIIGLLLVWAFIVPRDNLPDVPQVAENAAPVEAERPQASNADPMPAQEQAVAAASGDAQAANDSMAQSEPGQNPPQALPAAAPESGTASQGVATSDIGQPAGRDIATDQPVAGAEVSAQATTDTSPEPAATLQPSAPVMSAEEQALAIALATSAADMIARPPAPRPQPEATQPAATTAATTPNAARAEAPRLSSSARPVSAPRRQATAPAADAPPAVPDNPLPLETVQRQTPRPSGVRPPRPTARTAAPAPASVPTPPQQQVAPRPSTPAVSSLRSSSRPPSRPEGATPELQHERLTPAEQSHVDQFLRDLQQADRRGRDLVAIPGGETYRLAENRPQRRPASGGTASAVAVENAVRSAVDSDPPSARPGSASTVPARDSGGLLRSSNRPRGKPAGRSAAAPSLSDSAVTQAIAEAVDASTATPGAVALSALTSSNLPPRRSSAGRTAADPATSGAAEAPAAAAAPEASGPSDAQQAERRRLDEQLQSQAEARIRARAQADAAAEAQARAQAEARARAQVAAEERAAAARRQTYKPQELDDEPEVAQAVQSGGVTAASVAAAATQRRGIDLGRTTIIGIVGAGQASRALIRLRNGRIVTVRLGDRIDGGTINSIGGGKITYVKAGRQHELRLLDGR